MKPSTINPQPSTLNTQPSTLNPQHSTQWGFWRAYLVQMRPYLLFLSGAGGAAGMAMASHPNLGTLDYIIAFFPFFFGYGFGQALTDCFQTDTDKLSAPYRPLSKGIITIRDVKYTSLSGLTLSAFIYVYYNPYTIPVCLLIIFGLATYSFVKRRYTWLAPFYNAWVVSMLPLLGFMVISGQHWNEGIPAEVWKLCGLSFFAYANFVLVGYLKDIEADKETGYNTFPVVYGWQKSILFADLIAICTIVLFFWLHPQQFPARIFGVFSCFLIVIGLFSAHTRKVKNEQTALPSILSTVRSYILFLLAMILEKHPEFFIYAILYYLFFEYVLYHRPSKFQV